MTKTTRETAAEKGAKLPTDHEPATEPVDVELHGIRFTLDPADLSDFRLLRAMKRGDEDAVFEVFDRITGDRADDFLDALADEKGRVSMTAVGGFITDAFEAAGLGKS